MFSRARLEIETPISLFLVTSLVILRFSHDSLMIPMAILLSLWLFFYPYGYSLIPMAIPLSLCSPEPSLKPVADCKGGKEGRRRPTPRWFRPRERAAGATRRDVVSILGD